MMRIAFFALLLSLISGAAEAQSVSGDLQGTIGKLPIFLHYDYYPGSETVDNAQNIECRYFYQSSLKDIGMKGRRSGARITLIANGDDKSYDERFVLTLAGGGSFTGTWTNRKGTTLPVSLRPVNIASITNPNAANTYVQNLRKKDAFNYIRSAFFKLKRDSVTTYKGRTFAWVSETHCRVSFFRLANGFAASVPALINPQLDAIHFEQVMDELTCASSWGNSEAMSVDYTTSFTFLNEHLLGFQVSAYFDCGGAHPDGGSEGYLIGLHNGKRYEIDDIIAFSPNVTTEAASGFDKFSDYRSKDFAPQLFKLETAIHHFRKPVTDEDCDYTDLEVWDFPGWSFTEKGIAFTPIFARVMRACEEEFLVPFADLKRYRNPKFPYPFE